MLDQFLQIYSYEMSKTFGIIVTVIVVIISGIVLVWCIY